MIDHDLLVLGGGTGNIVANAAADDGLDVGLIERDRLGGTCLNRGCNPSKKLIHRADVAETVRTAEAVGIEATLESIDFERIVDDVETTITEAAEAKAERARAHSNITLYQCEGRFIDEKQVEVDAEGADEPLTAETIVLAGGSRPMIPDAIEGLEDTPFLTSADALYLDSLPDSLVIVGGGYIAVEMAHFFGQMGTDVTIIGSSDVLADREDREIAHALTDVYAEKHTLHLGYRATAIAADEDDRRVVTAESTDGDTLEAVGDRLLLAVGRQPNSDQWAAEAGGLAVDDQGFVETDDSLETAVSDVYAIGDIAGNYLFKHSGDTEAAFVTERILEGGNGPLEYPGMAHAIFGSPQVASLGMTEQEAENEGIAYDAGIYAYDETALGAALNTDGFVKALVADDGEILGCHIVGPEASTLIHEVSTAVAAGADGTTLARTIHVHPALSEVVQGAFREDRDVSPTGI